MNIQGIEMKRVEEGSFLYGTRFSLDVIEGLTSQYSVLPEWILKEMPQRREFLGEFWISELPVRFHDLAPFFAEYSEYKTSELSAFEDQFGMDFPAFPVNISLAEKFCSWLSAKTLLNVYVPTELQWEKAARGTSGYEYPWGNEESGPVKVRGVGDPTPDYSKRYENLSPYGVKFLAGNLEEVTSSRNSSYRGIHVHVPTELRYPILRGGTCEHDLDLARCARRHGKIPSLYTGFRVVFSERCPVEASSEVPFKIGGYAFAELISMDSEYIYLNLGEGRCGACSFIDVRNVDLSFFTSRSKVGSEVLVKVGPREDRYYSCSMPSPSKYLGLLEA